MKSKLITSAAAMLAAGAAVMPGSAPAQAAGARPPGWHNAYKLQVRGGYLSAITAPAADAVWVVGQKRSGPSSFLVRWNGHHWRLSSLPVRGFHAAAIASSSVRDVWLFGWTKSTLALRWDGGRWHRLSWPGLVGFGPASISVLGPDDVWIAAGPVPEHWNGHRWRAVPMPAACGAAGQLGASSDRSVWAVDAGFDSGVTAPLVVCHWNGEVWNRVWLPYNGDTAYVKLLVSGPNGWITGVQGRHRLWHLSAGRWHVLADRGDPYLTLGLTSYRSGGVWADWSEVWTGRKWISVPGPGYLVPAALASVPRSTQAWMVGSDLSGQVVLRAG